MRGERENEEKVITFYQMIIATMMMTIKVKYDRNRPLHQSDK
jgi:hypothetical protein